MAGLKIHIDTGEAERASQKLRKELAALGHEAVKDEKQFKALEARMLEALKVDKAKKNLESLQKSLNLTRQETAKFQAKIGDHSGAMSSLISGNDRAINSFGSLKAAVAGTIAILGVGGLVSVAKQASEELWRAGTTYDRTVKALEAITGSAGGAASQVDYLRQVSKQYGQNLYDLLPTYKNFLAATSKSGMVIEDTRTIFEGATKAIASMGLTSEETHRVLYALQQMVSKGMRGISEEVNQQMGEVLPGALGMFADSLGMSQEKLRDMMEQGNLTLDDLVKFGAYLGNQFSGEISKAIAAENKFRQQLEDLKVSIAGSGFMDSMTESIEALTEAIKDPELIKGLSRLVEFSAEMTEKAVSGASWFGNLIGRHSAMMEAQQGFEEGLIPAYGMIGEQNRNKYLEAYRDIKKAAQEAFEAIKKGSLATQDQIDAAIMVTTKRLEKLEPLRLKPGEGSPFKDVWDVQDEIDELEKELSRLEALGEKVREEFETPWVLNWGSAISKEAAVIDPAINNIMAAKRNMDEQNKSAKTLSEDMLKAYEKSDEQRLVSLSKGLKWEKDHGEARKEVIEQYESEISSIRQKMAAPAMKAAEEYKKAMSSLSDEYAKLAMTAQEYGKYEIDKWYAEEAAALGKVTPKLQETYELMLKKNEAKHEEIALEKAYKSVKDAISSAYENSWQSELDRFDTNNKKEQADEIKNAWTKAEKDMQEATEKSQKEYEKAMEAQKEAYIDFSDTIKDNVKDIIKSHENMSEKIVGIFEDMLYEIAATIISQKIVVPIGLQIGSALGATWNGTSMASMAGSGSNILGMASNASSLYNSFSGGTSNFLTTGMGGKIGAGIFGSSAWLGAGGTVGAQLAGGAGAGAMAGTGAGGFAAAGSAGAAGGAGLASTLAAVAPYAAIAAIAIPLLINAFKKEKDPVMAFHFGEDTAAGSTASDMGFYTYSQKMSGETNTMVKDYFENQFKSIDKSLGINFADVIKKRAASADAGTDLMGTGWNPESYGGVEATLKVASTWIAKNLAQGVAEAYGLNGLTNGVGGTATSFFESILPSGSENLLDAFVRFGAVMDGTEDAANALARQMELLSGDTTQAFLNLENILTVFQSIDAMVDPLIQIKDPLVQIVDQFETRIDSLKEANATLDQISQAEDKRTQALGLQLTGLSSSNVGSSLLNTITAGGDIESALTDIIGKSIADSLSVALTNEVMQGAITPFVEKVGQVFLDSGNDIEAVFAVMPFLMDSIDLSGNAAKIASFTDKWQAMFGSIESAEESLKNAEADRDAIGREYLSALREEVSILENRMNDAKAVYVGLLEDELNAQESMVSGLESAIDSISKYRDSLYSGTGSPLGLGSQQESLLIKRSVLAAQAMSGDVGSVNDLISTSQEYLAVAKDLSRTDLDYAREVAKTNALLKDVEDSAGKQLSEAEKQAQYFQGLIDSVNGTSEKITSIDAARTAYEAAKMEFDASWMQSEITNLEALLESSKSLEQLMAEYLTAQNTVRAGGGGGTKTTTDYAQAEADYLAANPDVAAAVAAGDFASGKQHYEMYGQYERRGLEGYAGLTSEGRYLNLYPDVAKAVQEGQFSSGLQHYAMYGEREGRGFATGGSFTVSGASGTDNLSLPQMRVTAGEIINISRPDTMAELRNELKALREYMEKTNYQLIKYAMTTAKVMKRSDDTDALLVRITA